MKLSKGPYGIHWFRRDLRIYSNPALQSLLKKTEGRTVGVFFFDSKFLARPDFSSDRFAFFLETLRSLKAEMKELGGDLMVLDHNPKEGWRRVFETLKESPPKWISFNRDYEPFARERDAAISNLLEDLGAEVVTERDHLILEPWELKKDEKLGGYYQIYTPFFKKWSSIIGENETNRIPEAKTKSEIQKDIKKTAFKLNWKDLHISKSNSFFDDALESFIQANQKNVKIPIPQAGFWCALERLERFKDKIDNYQDARDIPSISGTSGMSIYFKNGSITPALALGTLGLSCEKGGSLKPGRLQFLKEIVWREFYYHILFHRPSVEESSFLPQYKSLKWSNDEDWFAAWKEGKTGFPIVDAGMRQLKETGWMHNRVRMIVASFLTKDLLIDWRWGEKYFMNKLLDGDLAPNNGGWQWAASTGCDPQPYFRIFNPELQSKTFDPNGEFIKKYVPELRSVSSRDIHNPGPLYLKPIVNHAKQKEKALSLYRHNKT